MLKDIKENNKKWRAYLFVGVLLLITITIGILTTNEYLKSIFKSLSSISALSIFVLFVFEQAKQTVAFSYDKKKIAYDISMNSQFAYDLHNEYLNFCKRYVNYLYEIFPLMFRDGGTEKCLDYSHNLNKIRDEHTLVIPEKVHVELYEFEYVLRVLGAEYGYQNDVLGDKNSDDLRSESIKNTHKIYLQLMDINNKDKDKRIKNKEEIISYIRSTLGINRINELKEEVLES